jgi:hypothetical protein
MSRCVANTTKRFQQLTIAVSGSTRHARDMPPTKISRARLEEIVEEIIDNLRPLKCEFKAANRDVHRIIERGPPRNFHNRPAAVRQYAKRLKAWIAEGRALLPKPSSSRVLEVGHIPPEIRVWVLVASGATDILDGLQQWPYEQVEEWLTMSFADGEEWPYDRETEPTYMARVTHQVYKEFLGKLGRLADVAEKGLKYAGPTDGGGRSLSFYAPRFDPIKQSCAEDALHLITTLSRQRPSTAPEKNLRVIASLIYQAHGGSPDTDFERACDRSMKYWRQHNRTRVAPTEGGVIIRIVDGNGNMEAIEPRTPNRGQRLPNPTE